MGGQGNKHPRLFIISVFVCFCIFNVFAHQTMFFRKDAILDTLS